MRIIFKCWIYCQNINGDFCMRKPLSSLRVQRNFRGCNISVGNAGEY